MKKLILIFLLFTFSCGENKYGVTEGVFTSPYFPIELVEQTIVKAVGCETCIQSIEYPTGYPINTPRVLTYAVVFEINGELQIKRYHIGKVLTEEEVKDESYLRLIE